MAQPERHWIDNIADVISGRVHNTLKAQGVQIRRLEYLLMTLNETLDGIQLNQEIIMPELTQNQQIITDAANSLSQSASAIQSGIDAIRQADAARIAALEQQIIDLGHQPPAAEDLSEQEEALSTAVQGIATVAANLNPAPAGTPATGNGDDSTTQPVNPTAGAEIPGTDSGTGHTDHPGDPLPVDPATDTTTDGTPVADDNGDDTTAGDEPATGTPATDAGTDVTDEDEED